MIEWDKLIEFKTLNKFTSILLNLILFIHLTNVLTDAEFLWIFQIIIS